MTNSLTTILDHVSKVRETRAKAKHNVKYLFEAANSSDAMGEVIKVLSESLNKLDCEYEYILVGGENTRRHYKHCLRCEAINKAAEILNKTNKE